MFLIVKVAEIYVATLLKCVCVCVCVELSYHIQKMEEVTTNKGCEEVVTYWCLSEIPYNSDI